MKIHYFLLPALSAASALSRVAFAALENKCLTQKEGEDLIHGYLETFAGIPPGGNIDTVEAVAKKTFATDIKMYSQSLKWLTGYQGPFDAYPPFAEGWEAFTRQYNHTFVAYEAFATSYGCHTISISWSANFTGLLGLDPAFGLTYGVDLALVKPGTKKIGTIYSELNSLQTAIALGGHLTSNSNLTQCPPAS